MDEVLAISMKLYAFHSANSKTESIVTVRQ